MIKQKWIKLGFNDLAEVLALDELEKLNSMSITTDISSICQNQIDSVADSFRAAWNAKGYQVDVRDHYVDNGYRQYILCLARYFICSRFPNSKDIFLDEPRYELYKQSQELLKNPYLATSYPDYSGTELSALDLKNDDVAITLPFQRIISKEYKFGYIHPYTNDYQLSGSIFR